MKSDSQDMAMAETSAQQSETAPVMADAQTRPRLTFDLDVDICVIGAGLAGLTVAREAARMGATVAVLEGRNVGWNASGHSLGAVMPGFGFPAADLIDRVGIADARELWSLAQQGADYVRATVTLDAGPGATLTNGALEVSNVDVGDALIHRLQTLGDEFGTEVEGWQVDRVRDVVKTNRYFHAIHYPRAFQIDGRQYVHDLAALAERAGARIFEETPVVGIDPSGVRKRVVTPSARLRCSDIVMAGNVHIGAPAQRLAATLLPTWRYMGMTEPLGDRLAEAITFQGSVADTDDIDQFRVVGGDRLLWSSPETTWQANPRRFAKAIERRIATVFPKLGPVKIEDVWSGVFGQTVHGMPQIGQLRQGLWVVSGFGRQGLNTTAMGGQLIARSIVQGDDRWRLFAPFELVWAGGSVGRVAGHAFGLWLRGQSGAAGWVARYRERARTREGVRERAREVHMKAMKARVAADRERVLAASRRRDDRGGTRR
jgi:glycine/D-amino acid oxidase-like deaminating enzyme